MHLSGSFKWAESSNAYIFGQYRALAAHLTSDKGQRSMNGGLCKNA